MPLSLPCSNNGQGPRGLAACLPRQLQYGWSPRWGGGRLGRPPSRSNVGRCRLPSSGVHQKHHPDGFHSLEKGRAARCVSGANPHTCRASDTHLITHSMSCCHLPAGKKVFVIEALLWRGEALALFRHACGCQPVRRIPIRSRKVKGRARAQLRPSVTLETLHTHFHWSRFSFIDGFFFSR